MKKCFLLLLMIMFLIINAVIAADEPVRVIGDKIWGNSKKNLTYIEGKVRLTQGSTVITTEQVKIDSDKKLAFFDHQVKLAHPDVKIEADILEYDFKKKNGNFFKHVLLSRTEVKDQEGTVSKDPFRLTAEELYFETDTKNFIVTKNGEVTHKDFTGTADNIEYNDQKQILWFRGNAYLKRPGGEEVWGNRITIDVRDSKFAVDQVKLNNEDVKIQADDLDYDYKQKNGTFKKNVTLTRAEVRDAKGKVKKDQFQLLTTELFFESETKNFNTKSNSRVEHKDFTGVADQIEYNDQKQELYFKNNARLKRPKGEEITGEMMTINVDDKSFLVYQKVLINFEVEIDENKEEKPKK